MKPTRAFVRIIDRQTIIITSLSLFATFLCNLSEFYAELPSALIGIAVIFPIVFSINSAYRRREETLRYFASLKAHAVAIYYAHRDWAPEGTGQAERAKDLIQALLHEIMDYFMSSDRGNEKEQFRRVYEHFSMFSKSHEYLRQAGVPANEISRVNQYLRAMIIDFEKMRNILLYRTPISLRAYSQVFLNSFPIIYAPYFASLGNKSCAAVGYLVAILYSLVLVSLDNIQERLENPYDKIGLDDVNLDESERYAEIMDSAP